MGRRFLPQSTGPVPRNWASPKSGIPYYLAVQTPESKVASLNDLANTQAGHRRGGWALGAALTLSLAGALGYGGWHDHAQRQQVAATAQQQRDFVPDVLVGEVRPSGPTMQVSLPGATFAYEAANIYARANGYILKRNVDIGDHVKTGDLLAELTAPELDHQISQAQATLVQAQATLRQNQASKQLAQVTNDRIGTLVKQGWATTQLGDTDRLSLEAQDASSIAVACRWPWCRMGSPISRRYRSRATSERR